MQHKDGRKGDGDEEEEEEGGGMGIVGGKRREVRRRRVKGERARRAEASRVLPPRRPKFNKT